MLQLHNGYIETSKRVATEGDIGTVIRKHYIRVICDLKEVSWQTTKDLWFAHLVRGLKERFTDDEQSKMRDLLNIPTDDPIQIHRAFLAAGDMPLVVLDDLDRRLERNGESLSVEYRNMDLQPMIVKALVDFWSYYVRRWECIRPKILLPADLFDQIYVGWMLEDYVQCERKNNATLS